ncbi:DUF2946 family protein, partial [Ideonella sp.]|uniref:DUF2946 family protein n=1 Tax=Ideonella sp. TaxID=1929293 RepID=UPI003BB52064
AEPLNRADRISRMHRDRSLRLLTTWLAALAMLLAAVAPAISHAWSPASGADWREVCSASGTLWLAAADDGSDPQSAPRPGHALDHCPCCALHAELAVLPASPVLQAVSATAQPWASAVPPSPHPTAPAWLSAQPRAPPERF